MEVGSIAHLVILITNGQLNKSIGKGLLSSIDCKLQKKEMVTKLGGWGEVLKVKNQDQVKKFG